MSQATDESQGHVHALPQQGAELQAQVDALRTTVAELRAREQTLATHNLVLIGLSRNRAIEQGDTAAALEQITTAAAHTLDVERVGVWVFSDDRSRIRALDLYERGKNAHSSGMELKAADFPAYFHAVEENRTIAADDARIDPRTREFAESYLVPLGITSMLDAPVRVGSRLVGIICHEHIGPPRHRGWTLEEQAFAGSMADFVALALQASDRQKAEVAVRDSERRLRQIIDLVPHLVFVKDRHGRLLLVNQAVADCFGTTVDALVGKHLADVHFNVDEARAMLEEDREVLESGRPKFFSESILTDRCGVKHVVQKTKVPFHVAGTNEHVILGVAVDITDRKRAEQQQQLMIQELDHRVKNTLAQVLSIAEQTASESGADEGKAVQQFITAFSGRVRSLALAHELLAHAKWEGADLRAIAQRLLAPFAPVDSGRVIIEGESVLLSARTAPVISMVIHELATNAAKHGSLSSPRGAGKVHVKWSVRRCDTPAPAPGSAPGDASGVVKDGLRGRELHLTWIESSGPVVAEPERRGLGTTLIERAVSYQLHGTARLNFEPGGLRCELRIPLGEGAHVEGAVRSRDRGAEDERPWTFERAPGGGGDAAAARPLGRSDRLRVLVVEDDVLVATSLRSMLDQLGCEVLGPVASPDEACQIVRTKDPDAAILDVNLSPGTSAAVARTLLLRGRPFTFVTGYSSIKALPDDLRGHRVLAKPVTKEMLEDAVREMKTLSALRK
jgi:PAS domain S-box-containing protein